MRALARLSAGGADYAVRRAGRDDVAAIVALIATDQVGATRDGGDLAPYERAFAAMPTRRARAQLLVVVTDARRTEAHRFYGRLGFTASHDGFKLRLADA